MSYLLTFERKPTLTNSSKFINLINKINNDKLSLIVVELIPKFFMLKDNKIINNSLTKDLVVNKKDVITFTQEQRKSINAMLDVIRDEDKNTYGLFGYAGTGKTTILVEFISYLLEQRLIHSVVFTAPTNKAVSVIKSKFKNYLINLYKIFNKDPKETAFDMMISDLHEHGVIIDFITIHKLLKFEVDFNVDGNIVFVRNDKKSLFESYEIIIIDECSMIPLKMLDTIFNEIRKHKSRKVIFSGDPSQLPPVNENKSFIFDFNINIHEYNSRVNLGKEIDEIIKKRYETLTNDVNNMGKITLTKIKRCRIKIITEVCYQFRQWTNGILPKFKQFRGKVGIKFYKYNNEPKIETKWFKTCLDYNAKDKNNIILSWTNKQTDEYNTEIRKKLFNKEKLNKFEIGDIIIMNDFYNAEKDIEKYLTEEKKIYTSEQLKVNNVKLTNVVIKDFSDTLSDSVLKLKEGKYYNNVYKKMIERINKNTKKQYNCWEINVSKLSDEKESSYIIYVVCDDDIKTYNFDKDFIANAIRQLYYILSKKLNNLKDQIEQYVIKPVWHKYHEKFIEAFANVNYGYAITCHKGQGSNFYNVFVDVNDIGKNRNEPEMKRCLYTAVTRTSNELHILL
jgi:hypothetical protein